MGLSSHAAVSARRPPHQERTASGDRSARRPRVNPTPERSGRAARHDLRPYEAAFILGLTVRQLGHRMTRGDIEFGYAGRCRRVPVAVVRELKRQSPLAQLAIDAIVTDSVRVPTPGSCAALPVPLEEWAGALCAVRRTAPPGGSLKPPGGSRGGR